MSKLVLSIAREFSAFPAGRKRSDGPFTGELFREEIIGPSLKRGEHITLDLDGVEGLPSSFLEEVFGGLVRDGYTIETLRDLIDFKCTDPDLSIYPDMAWRFATEAQSIH